MNILNKNTDGKPVIVLDAGKVLVDFDFGILYRQLSKACGTIIGPPVPAQMEKLFIEFEKGSCSLKDMADGLNRELGLSFSPGKWRELFCTIFVGEIPGMREVLSRFKEKFYLVAMSNTSKIHWEFVIKEFQIFDLLDGWVVSFEEGLVKPDARLYRTAMNRFCDGNPPLFYTDDIEKYVETASILGWQAAVFRDAEQFEKEVLKRS